MTDQAADLLNVIGLTCGLVGLGITAWDLLPEVQLHRARTAMERARTILEMMNTIQQNKLAEKGEIGPAQYGKGVEVLNAQFIDRMVRLRGLDDDLGGQLVSLIGEADRRLGKRRSGASFVFTSENPGVPVTQDDYLAALGGLTPEVRQFFDVDQTLRDREAEFAFRPRPPLLLGIGLLASSYIMPAIAILRAHTGT